MSTHILASELSEPALREALRAGRAYVSHDWMCDPTGFRFELTSTPEAPSSTASSAAQRVALMGDTHEFAKGLQLVAEFPVSCRVRLIKSGELVFERRETAWSTPCPAPEFTASKAGSFPAASRAAGSIEPDLRALEGLSCSRECEAPAAAAPAPNPKSKI